MLSLRAVLIECEIAKIDRTLDDLNVSQSDRIRIVTGIAQIVLDSLVSSGLQVVDDFDPYSITF